MAEIMAASGEIFIVDDADFNFLSSFSWRVARMKNGQVYAMTSRKTNGKKKSLLMHRMILNAPQDMLVDHIDGNAQNNRRSNLRLATRSQNKMNSFYARGISKYRGVSFHKGAGKWYAAIRKQGHIWHLGYFDTEEAAFAAYRLASLQLHGEFSPFRREP